MMEVEVNLGKRAVGRDLEYRFYGKNAAESPHVLITGKTGYGKSYFTISLIKKLQKAGANTLYFDYSGSADMELLQKANVKRINVKNLQLNFFAKRYNVYGVEETDRDAADRLADVLQNNLKLGDKQRVIVANAILQLYQNGGGPSFENLYWKIKDDDEDENTNQRILNQIRGYSCLDSKNDTDQDWNSILFTEEATIFLLDFEGIGSQQKSVKIAELYLSSLMEYVFAYTEKDIRPAFVVLEEMHRLSQKEEMPVCRLLHEGRRFGLGTICVTQSLYKFDRETVITLEMAALSVAFCQTDTDAKRLSSAFAVSSGEQEKLKYRLKVLGRGEAFASGRFVKEDGKLTNRVNVFFEVPEIG